MIPGVINPSPVILEYACIAYIILSVPIMAIYLVFFRGDVEEA